MGEILDDIVSGWYALDYVVDGSALKQFGSMEC